eukprot:XP_002517569.2 NAC transcription factor 32 [Ricinus communis]
MPDADIVPAVDNNNREEGEYLKILPPGYKFKPSDGELIVHYLQRKILNQTLPPHRINELEMYKFNPETLAADYASSGNGGREEWYFFSPRDQKYPNGSRLRRDPKCGYWKSTGAYKDVRFNGHKVGLKRLLVFYKRRSPFHKTDWIMHEFSINNPLDRRRPGIHDMELWQHDWVLCRVYNRIYNKPPKASSRPAQQPLEIENENHLPAQPIVGANGLDSSFAQMLEPASSSPSEFPCHQIQLPSDLEYDSHLPRADQMPENDDNAITSSLEVITNKISAL